MSSKKIFITGSTGFLGSYILREILVQTDADIILLVRGRSQYEAEARVFNILKDFFKHRFFKNRLNRIKVLKGDIMLSNFGFKKSEYKNLIRNIDEIYHSAATTDLGIKIVQARLINLVGTKSIIKFAKNCIKLSKIHYISTAFIAGTKEGLFKENDLFVKQDFNNAYEQSKFEAELLFRYYGKNKVKIVIYRPSIIIGEYKSGKTTSFKMFYQPLRFFYNEFFEAVPLNPNTLYNLIPVDVAAKTIVFLALNYNRSSVFHIVSKQNILLGHIMDICSNYLSFKKPAYISREQFDRMNIGPIRKKMIEPFLGYFNFKAIFDNTKTLKVLGNLGFKLSKINDNYIYRILEYCIKSNFLKNRNNSSFK